MRKLLFPLLFWFLSAAPLSANPDGWGLSDTPRGAWLDQVRDATVLWGGGYWLSFRADYHTLHLPVEGFPVNDRVRTLRGTLSFAYGLPGGWLDLHTAIDFHGRWTDPADAEGRETPEAASEGDAGDSRLGLRVALPSPYERLSASLEGFMTLATGNPDKDFSTHSNDGGAILGLSLHGRSYRLHLQTGYRVNRNEDEGALLYPLFYPKVPEGGDDTDNDALILRGAVEVSTPGIDLFLEVFADRLLWSDAVGGSENPLQITPGVRARLRRGLYLSSQVGFSLASDDPETAEFGGLAGPEALFPDWRFSLALHMTGLVGGEDRDGDGIEDAFDKCPDAPEDFDGFEDENGCPDKDNDRDGIEDDWDKMPYDAEDFDGFEDEDGAPDFDNDADGIPDVEDYCPDEPEDLDGDRDADGCPDGAVESNDGERQEDTKNSG